MMISAEYKVTEDDTAGVVYGRSIKYVVSRDCDPTRAAACWTKRAAQKIADALNKVS